MNEQLYRIDTSKLPLIWPRELKHWIVEDVLVPVEPDAWGITTWRQLYETMTVAETIGDFVECTDALGAALGIGDTE